MRLSRRDVLFAAPLLALGPRVASASEGRVVLGRFTTGFAFEGEQKARALNVQLAAEAIDDQRVAPGGVLSFNAAVGERTAALGFAKSSVIRDAMMAEGVGGGTCQVASTLHAAALLAGLEIVRRAPHSRPSAYIRMGLDAVVVFPSIDLAIRNTWAEVVTVRARAARGKLEVWLEAPGAAPPAVTLTSEIVAWLPFERVIERDRAVAEDAVHVRAFGIPGYRVLRTREVRTPGGAERRDFRRDLYPPTPEIVRVAPSFDAARLAGRLPAPGPSALGFTVVIDPGVARPVRVQLRPSTRVVLGSAAPEPSRREL